MQSLPDCPLLNLIDGVSASYFDRVKGNGSIQEVNILKLNLFLCDIREKRKLETTKQSCDQVASVSSSAGSSVATSGGGGYEGVKAKRFKPEVLRLREVLNHDLYKTYCRYFDPKLFRSQNKKAVLNRIEAMKNCLSIRMNYTSCSHIQG